MPSACSRTRVEYSKNVGLAGARTEVVGIALPALGADPIVLAMRRPVGSVKGGCRTSSRLQLFPSETRHHPPLFLSQPSFILSYINMWKQFTATHDKYH